MILKLSNTYRLVLSLGTKDKISGQQLKYSTDPKARNSPIHIPTNNAFARA